MSNETYEVTKSTAECYKFRHPSGMYWANIYLDHSGEQGRILIVSDYGQWQNYWSHCGREFKAFLVGLDIEYAANKFSCNQYFDVERNLKAVREYIAGATLGGAILKKTEKKLLKEIEEIENECGNDVQQFHALVNATDHLSFIYYDGFHVIKTIDPGFRSFWEKVWPEFVAALNEELAECIGCRKRFEVEHMLHDDASEAYCRPCWDVLSPVMKAEYDELVAKGEIEPEDDEPGTLNPELNNPAL